MQLKKFSLLSFLGTGKYPRPGDSTRARRKSRLRPRIDFLERRVALTTYLWTALGDGTTWNDSMNWLHFEPLMGMKEPGAPTPYSDVVFPPLAALPKASSAMINVNLTYLYMPLNSLTIDDSYTLSGNPIQVNQLLSVSNPFTPAPGGTDAKILLAGLKLAPGATINTGTGSTLELASATTPTTLQLTLLGGLIKTGGGELLINTQSVFFPTTPLVMPVAISIAGGSITLGANVNLNAINFQIGSTGSLVIADNVAARVRSLTGTGLVDLEGTSTVGDLTSLTVLVPADTTDQFGGFIDGIGQFIMGGNGTLTTGTIDFGGAGSIEAGSGTLDVDGSISAGTLQVTSIATFGGLGMWTFSGAAVFQAGSTFAVTLDGTNAGSQYTQLVDTNSVSGVNLGYSTLAASIGYEYEQGDEFTIVSAPVIQNGFQNVVAGRATLGGVPFAVTSTGTSVTIAPLQSVTTTQLAGSANPSNPGVPVTFTAAVTTRTAPVTSGTVSFMQGTTVVATVSVNGAGEASLTTTSLPVGSTAITAVYNGATGILASTSPTLTQSVVPYTTLTSLVSAGNPSLTGQPVTFTASVSAAGTPVTAGTATFWRGSRFLGTVPLGATGAASLSVSSLPVGTVPIQAVYNGTVDFLSSVSPVLKQKISPLPTTTSLSLTTQRLPNGSSRYLLTATVMASEGTSIVPVGTVVFRRNGVALGKSKLVDGIAQLVLGRKAPRRGRFVAAYLGKSQFRPSTSSPVTFAG